MSDVLIPPNPRDLSFHAPSALEAAQAAQRSAEAIADALKTSVTTS